jgi:hypothetical protein
MQAMGQDINHDGKIDSLKVQIGATDVKAVTGVNILLEFTYRIEVRCKHHIALGPWLQLCHIGLARSYY